MRTRATTCMMLAGALGVVIARSAGAGTCTVVPGGFFSVSQVPSAGEVLSLIPDADGLVIPVDVDEAAGTITVHRESLSQLEFDSQGGTVQLAIDGSPVVGTIDAAGHVVLPNFTIDTIFVGIHLPQSPTMMTGLQSGSTFPEQQFPSRGVPLDFSTGIVTVDGTDTIPSAPIVEEPVASDFKIRCQLSPIPNPANLPRGSTLKVTGTGKDDGLAVTARLKPGSGKIDLADKDVMLWVTDASGRTDVLVVLVRAESFGGKAKKRTATDTDGQTVRVLEGGAGDTPPTGGSAIVTSGKRGVTARFQLKGLDPSALTGNVRVALGVGTAFAESAVTVQAKGAKRRLN